MHGARRMGRRKEAALEEGGFVAGIEKLIATKDVGERTLYCFLAGTLRRRPSTLRSDTIVPSFT